MLENWVKGSFLAYYQVACEEGHGENASKVAWE